MVSHSSKKTGTDGDAKAKTSKTAVKPVAAKKAAPVKKTAETAAETKPKAPKKTVAARSKKDDAAVADSAVEKEPTSPVAESVTPSPATAPAPVESATAAEATAGNVITMKPPIIVKELALRLGIKPFQVVHELMEMNIFATLNQQIDEEAATKVCTAKGFKFELERRKEGQGVHKKTEEPIVVPKAPTAPEEEHAPVRPPVITFMGHVDHGKTSLLDAIRKTRVAAGEAGGITQHIGAYSIEHDGKHITFLDTPGHEAFTAMRARGTSVTDIAVIVVAADDGLMPTTLEAIQHAKAALAANPNHFAIMVAINKIDLPGANIDKVKGQLQEIGLSPEDWGGTVICCPVSATKGQGVKELLDSLYLQSEILELKADAKRHAHGVVIESQIDVGRGPNATVIIQHGTLHVGDAFICGSVWGKVKALIGDTGKPVKSAGPSTPVRVLGLSGTPSPGDEFTVMPDEREARQLAQERAEAGRLDKLTTARPVTLENLFDSIADGQKKVLNIILKSDVQGSLEAIIESLKKIPSEKVDVNFVLTAVGPITVNDVLLAKASQAVIIGFGTKVDNAAANAAKRESIQIKLYSIIYELIDQVKEAMAGLLDPELRESSVGKAVVKKVFDLTKYPVAGCLVESGRIVRTGRARVLRKNQAIYDGAIQTLKRFQDDASEVRTGMECGIRLGNFTEYLEGDIIECYILEKVAQAL